METKIQNLFIAVAILLPMSGWAQFTFAQNADNTITITGYTGSVSNLVIPDSINGYPVTIIGDYAFVNRVDLTNAAIPDSVINIGFAAFGSCSLRNVIIGNNVTNIGPAAFINCHLLTNSLNIPDSVINIGADAFQQCALTNVTIGNGVTTIGFLAFGECLYLQNVTIGNNVRIIADQAFIASPLSDTIIIPSSVTNIGNYAFNSINLHQAFFLGNAPKVNGGAITNIFPTGNGTVYYVPGTTGWTNTFGGWPTAGWYQSAPQILGSSYGFGVQSNGFQFTISWATNAAVVVETTTNLQNWTPITTNTLVNGISFFRDSNWTNYPRRFYHIRPQ